MQKDNFTTCPNRSNHFLPGNFSIRPHGVALSAHSWFDGRVSFLSKFGYRFSRPTFLSFFRRRVGSTKWRGGRTQIPESSVRSSVKSPCKKRRGHPKE
jgi:hypothetical protein